MVSLTGKQPTHCGVVALPLKDIKICKAKAEERRIPYYREKLKEL